MSMPPLWWSESVHALYTTDDGSDYWVLSTGPAELVDELPADAVELAPKGAQLDDHKAQVQAAIDHVLAEHGDVCKRLGGSP